MTSIQLNCDKSHQKPIIKRVEIYHNENHACITTFDQSMWEIMLEKQEFTQETNGPRLQSLSFQFHITHYENMTLSQSANAIQRPLNARMP